MNLLITGCCGHIGSYLVNNIHKIGKIKKTFIIDTKTTNSYYLDKFPVYIIFIFSCRKRFRTIFI